MNDTADLTQTKKKQVLAKTKYQAIVETSHDMVFLLKEKKITYANPSALKILGYFNDELIGKEASVLFLEKTKKNELLTCNCSQSTENNLSFDTYDSQFVTKNGSIKYVLISCSASSIKKENLCIIAARDITKRKMLEKEKESLIKELEEKNNEMAQLIKIKNNFLSIASHDLRSPFISLLGYAELLLEESNLDSNSKNYVERIKKSAEDQLRYVNDLLNILKLESREIPLQIEQINISKLIESCIENHQVMAKNKEVTLQMTNSINQLMYLDPAKIIQVLNNLLTNAIKFTPEKGMVSISLEVKNNNNEIKIHVKDTGVGIPDKNKNLLFQKDNKLTTTGTSGEKGTGLGLAICKNLIELHGGNITLTSTVNLGSDFCVTLPIKNSEE